MTIKINGTNTTAQPSITGADTDTGLVYGTDEVQIVTGGTTRATVDSSGNVGIGRTPVSGASGYVLQLRGTSFQSFLQFSTATQGDTLSDGFVIGSDNTNAYIIQRENSHISFFANSAERLRILPSGGITFNGDTAAANALDDYEEGTWTPTIANLTLGNGSLTAHYTKTGNICHLSFRLVGGSTTSFAGSMNGITGFPFSSALASNSGYLTASNPNNNWFGFTQQYNAGSGSNFIQWDVGSNNNSVGSNTVPFTWGDNTFMRFNMTYRTD